MGNYTYLPGGCNICNNMAMLEVVILNLWIQIIKLQSKWSNPYVKNTIPLKFNNNVGFVFYIYITL